MEPKETLDTTLQLYQILWPILLAILSFLIGLVGYFLKDIRQQLKEKQDRQDREISEIRSDLAAFKETLPRQYVMREDFLRSITALDMKIDNLSKDVSELVKSVSKMLGGGDRRA